MNRLYVLCLVLSVGACSRTSEPKAQSVTEWDQQLTALVPPGTSIDSAEARLRRLGLVCRAGADSTASILCDGPLSGGTVTTRRVAKLQTSGANVVAVRSEFWLTGP